MVEFEGHRDPAGHILCNDDPGGQYAPFIAHTTGNAVANGQKAPAGHVEQTAVSPVGLNVPAGHGLQTTTDPFTAVKPGIHRQFLM